MQLCMSLHMYFDVQIYRCLRWRQFGPAAHPFGQHRIAPVVALSRLGQFVIELEEV